jgi:hypothetical protein
MKRIWAPWRMEFIGSGPKGCVFCTLPKNGDDRESLILRRGLHTFVMMNRFPYNNGHALIVPSAHKGRMDDLSDEEMLALSYMLSKPEACFPIQSPEAVALTGYYPTRSCIRYTPAKDEYTVSMEDFVLRQASPPGPVPDAASGKP